MSSEDFDKLSKAVDYLETATNMIEDDGGDEDDIDDARETIRQAREVLIGYRPPATNQ